MLQTVGRLNACLRGRLNEATGNVRSVCLGKLRQELLHERGVAEPAQGALAGQGKFGICFGQPRHGALRPLGVSTLAQDGRLDQQAIRFARRPSTRRS